MSDEMKKVDPEKRAALLEFWEIMWRKEKAIVVFANTEEALDAGLPTLVTMNELARRVTGCEVVHYGFGCFGAKTYKNEEIFGFCGGGAMQHSKEIDCSYTILTIRKESRRLVIKLMREICPKAFAYVEEAKARRKAERMQEAEYDAESEMMKDDAIRQHVEAKVRQAIESVVTNWGEETVADAVKAVMETPLGKIPLSLLRKGRS